MGGDDEIERIENGNQGDDAETYHEQNDVYQR